MRRFCEWGISKSKQRCSNGKNVNTEGIKKGNDRRSDEQPDRAAETTPEPTRWVITIEARQEKAGRPGRLFVRTWKQEVDVVAVGLMPEIASRRADCGNEGG